MTTSYAGRRALKRAGRTITLINRTAQTTNGSPDRDDHGNIKWDSESKTDTSGSLVYRGSPKFQRRADGIDIEVDVIAYVPDDQPVYDGEDDEERRSTRIEVNGERYVVRQTFDENNGVIRCHGVKEDS